MKVAVLIPVFNHRRSVARVIGELRAERKMGWRLLWWDDGCTDGSGEIFRELKKAGEITLLTHVVNLGKGQALLTGFRYASEMGYTHVLTVRCGMGSMM